MLNRGLVLFFHAFHLFRLTQMVSYDIFLVNSSVFLFYFLWLKFNIILHKRECKKYLYDCCSARTKWASHKSKPVGAKRPSGTVIAHSQIEYIFFNKLKCWQTIFPKNEKPYTAKCQRRKSRKSPAEHMQIQFRKR